MMHPVFAAYLITKCSLSADELKLIDQVSTVKKLRKHQYLLQEGDTWQYNAFVASGCMRIYRVDLKGSIHIIQFCPENYWTGDRESLLSGEASRSNIDAIEDSEIVLIRKDPFEGLRKQIPSFDAAVSNILQRSFNNSQNRIHSAISLSAEERYLEFINTHHDLANRVPQSMIASYLGISPETLSRIRKDLAKK